jgi:CubicO group peptidase (beta-lactamase class C family)
VRTRSYFCAGGNVTTQTGNHDADGGARNGVGAVIDEAVSSGRIVGAVVLVSRNAQLVYRSAAGFADREAGESIRADSIFRFASLTKPIVSVAAVALLERKLLDLEDPVVKFIPSFRPKSPDGREPVITIRHLLTHTAGLTYKLFEPGAGPYHRANVSDGMDQPGLSMAENLARITSAGLLFEPGTAWGYSVATDVLGEVLARAANTSLPALISELITGPLSMRDTGFTAVEPQRLVTQYADGSPTPRRMSTHQLVPFQSGALSFAPDRLFDPKSYPSGGGGLVGTAPDFLAFLETMRNGGAPILTPKGMALLTNNAIGEMSLFLPGWKFGLGWALLDDPSHTGTPQSRGSWTWGGVYGNLWFVDPAKGISVVILTNTSVAGMAGPFPDAIRDAVYRGHCS